MFSFTHSSNPFPSFPSSSSYSYPPLPFYIDPHNSFASNSTLLQDPLAVLPFMPSQAPTPQTVTNLSVANCTAMFQKDAINIDAHYGGGSISKFLKKKPVRKDRHSKIHTSQGLRDRRVRLSSEIARKFFDLQDMLECDKPSNTLEWLLTKSENAIKELARSKHSCSEDHAKCFCFSSDPKGVVDSNDHKSLVCAAKERKLKWDQEKEDVGVKAKKESREKARARARQRTSSKPARCTSLQLQILHRLMPPIQPHDACSRYPQLLGSEASRDGFDVVGESIVLKRNLKPSLMSYQHQNLVIPREASFNNNDYPSLSNSPQNWDTMNLSTELQIFGNSWEECTNQCRH